MNGDKFAAEDARCVACFAGPRIGDRPHQTAKATGLAGEDRHRLAMAADTACVDPRNARFERRIVDQETDFKIVRAVEYQIGPFSKLQDVRVIDVGHDGLNGDLRVDAAEFVGRGNGLGDTGGDVLLVEEHLPLQVV